MTSAGPRPVSDSAARPRSHSAPFPLDRDLTGDPFRHDAATTGGAGGGDWYKGRVFDWLTGLVSASPLTYLLVLGLAVADIVGIVPAETVITAATLLAMEGRLLIVGVGLTSVAGVAAGDTLLYVLGSRLGNRLASRLFRSDRARERLDWARRQMSQRGAVIIIGGRWLPMGRTLRSSPPEASNCTGAASLSPTVWPSRSGLATTSASLSSSGGR